MGVKARPLAERLLDQIDGPWAGRVGIADCWPFTGRWHSAWGYGMIRGDAPTSAPLLAHREMLRLSIPEFDPGLTTRHTCDFPPCCNPTHLLQGTQLENVADQIKRMRRRLGRGRRRRPDLWRNPTPEDYE